MGVGFSAINSRKTHCPNGHEYTEENLITYLNGSKRCKLCHYASNRRYSREKYTIKI